MCMSGENCLCPEQFIIRLKDGRNTASTLGKLVFDFDTGDPFPGGKARPGRDADHSPPSSVEVENE
jgi:hypothetical protein